MLAGCTDQSNFIFLSSSRCSHRNRIFSARTRNIDTLGLRCSQITADRAGTKAALQLFFPPTLSSLLKALQRTLRNLSPQQLQHVQIQVAAVSVTHSHLSPLWDDLGQQSDPVTEDDPAENYPHKKEHLVFIKISFLIHPSARKGWNHHSPNLLGASYILLQDIPEFKMTKWCSCFSFSTTWMLRTTNIHFPFL